MTEKLYITLHGRPISTNHVYKTLSNSSRKYMSKEGKSLKESYRRQAIAICSSYNRECTKSLLKVDVFLYFNDKRKRDIDNFHKIAQDSMEGIVYDDDSQIADIRIRKRVDKTNPRIEYVFSILENNDA